MPVEDPIKTGRIETPLQTAPNTSLTEEERSWGSICHIAGVAGVLGTLIAWMMKKDTSKWVDEQGKQAVNFHLTNLIIAFVCAIIIIGLPVTFLIGPYSLIFSILAGMKVKEGVPYKYPFSFNLIK